MKIYMKYRKLPKFLYSSFHSIFYLKFIIEIYENIFLQKFYSFMYS